MRTHRPLKRVECGEFPYRLFDRRGQLIPSFYDSWEHEPAEVQMPKYFFDFGDDADICRDDEGIEFPDADAACQEMRSTLFEMGKYAMLTDPPQELVGIIRNENGVLWRGQLYLQVEWTDRLVG